MSWYPGDAEAMRIIEHYASTNYAPKPRPCHRCHGRGYLTEDPLPDCPAGPSVYEQTECPACEGTGEQAP